MHRYDVFKQTGFLVCVALIACSGAERHDGAAEPGDALHPEALMGSWRANFVYGLSAGAGEQIDFRSDGSARLTRHSPFWDSPLWTASYRCEWAAAAETTATRQSPWILQQSCDLVSRTEPAEEPGWASDYAYQGTHFNRSNTIVAVAYFGFTVEESTGTDTYLHHEYERVDQR